MREAAASAAWGVAMREGFSAHALQRRALDLYCAAVGVSPPASLTVSDEVL